MSLSKRLLKLALGIKLAPALVACIGPGLGLAGSRVVVGVELAAAEFPPAVAELLLVVGAYIRTPKINLWYYLIFK